MRILMVEDDKELCRAVAFQLEQEGYTVDMCHDGDDGLYFAKQQIYDLILLDRMLPKRSGVSLLEKIRGLGISTPVLMVTAMDTLGDKVSGLDAGADDYLAKPFAVPELLARIRALCRRPSGWKSNAVLTVGGLSLDVLERTLSDGGQLLSLSKREAQLFEVFFKNPGQVLPREVLLSAVWGPDAPVEDGNLDSYILFLRRRLKALGGALQIKTVRSVGYSLENGHV